MNNNSYDKETFVTSEGKSVYLAFSRGFEADTSPSWGIWETWEGEDGRRDGSWFGLDVDPSEDNVAEAAEAASEVLGVRIVPDEFDSTDSYGIDYWTVREAEW